MQVFSFPTPPVSLEMRDHRGDQGFGGRGIAEDAVVNPLVQAGWKVLVATRRTARAKGANDLVSDLGLATLFELDKGKIIFLKFLFSYCF